jgi:ubiquinone/menaquinone biosynthesis C-methylase UbiE
MMNTFSPTPPDEDQKHLANSSLPFLTENEAEVARLMLQHRRLTELMGNALPPTLNLSRVRRVLDVGCGVGAWVYEMAWRHPDMQLVGIDKSAYFIDQALRHIFGGIPKITYLVQDMHHLEGEMFAPGSFDLIHMRFLVGDVTVQAFPSLLRSLAHLCRPGGFFVWTEAEFPLTTSPACQHLFSLVLHALQAAGRAFAPGYSLGITSCMGRWLRDAGYRIAQDQAYAIEVSAGTKGHEMFARQAYVFGNQVQPFLLETKATTATEFEEVFTQMQKEIRDESFCGLCFLRTVVGVKL